MNKCFWAEIWALVNWTFLNTNIFDCILMGLCTYAAGPFFTHKKKNRCGGPPVKETMVCFILDEDRLQHQILSLSSIHTKPTAYFETRELVK